MIFICVFAYMLVRAQGIPVDQSKNAMHRSQGQELCMQYTAMLADSSNPMNKRLADHFCTRTIMDKMNKLFELDECAQTPENVKKVEAKCNGTMVGPSNGDCRIADVVVSCALKEADHLCKQNHYMTKAKLFFEVLNGDYFLPQKCAKEMFEGIKKIANSSRGSEPFIKVFLISLIFVGIQNILA